MAGGDLSSSSLAEQGWGQALGDSTRREGARGRLGHPGRHAETRVLSRDTPETEKLEKMSMGPTVPDPVLTSIPLPCTWLSLSRQLLILGAQGGPRAGAERQLGP